MSGERHQPLRGSLYLVVAVLMFACMDTATKVLAQRYPVPLIVAVRYVVNLLLMIVVLAPRQGRALLVTRRTGWVLARSACLVVASLMMGLALKRMPVAETTAILFVAPVAVVFVSGLALGERTGVIGWLGALGGFAGVLLIARPGSGLEPLGVLFALATATVNVAYQLLSRLLAASERTLALLFNAVLMGSVVYGLAAPWFVSGEPPSAVQMALFLSLGVLGGIGHFLYTAAYRHASAATLAPMNYVQLVWAGLLGWLTFGHLPDRVALLGMTIIAAAGVAVALSNRRRDEPDVEPAVAD